MSAKIPVPDSEAPTVKLCWIRDRIGIVGSAGLGPHCILQAGHEMPHSWALGGRIAELEDICRLVERMLDEAIQKAQA